MAYSEFAMKTAGVDFASQNKNTAVCIINWDRGDLGVESVCTGIDDDFVRALAANVNHLGIDIPLGWPIAFSDAVHDYVHGKPWPNTYDHKNNKDFRYRRTDIWVKMDLKLSWPLSVSTDRIAIPAMRAASLFQSLDTPVARDGSGVVVEVYPAAALRSWKLDWKGYKKPEDSAKPEEILTAILGQLGDGFNVDQEVQSRLHENDNALDAFISALVARAHAIRKCHSIPDVDLAVALREGWIAVPRPDTLGQLLD